MKHSLGATFVCVTKGVPRQGPGVCVVQEMCLKVDPRHLCFGGRPEACQHLTEFDQSLFPETQGAMPRTEFLQSKQPVCCRCCHLHTCIAGLAEHRHFDSLMDDREIDKLGGGNCISESMQFIHLQE